MSIFSKVGTIGKKKEKRGDLDGTFQSKSDGDLSTGEEGDSPTASPKSKLSRSRSSSKGETRADKKAAKSKSKLSQLTNSTSDLTQKDDPSSANSSETGTPREAEDPLVDEDTRQDTASEPASDVDDVSAEAETTEKEATLPVAEAKEKEVTLPVAESVKEKEEIGRAHV